MLWDRKEAEQGKTMLAEKAVETKRGQPSKRSSKRKKKEKLLGKRK